MDLKIISVRIVVFCLIMAVTMHLGFITVTFLESGRINNLALFTKEARSSNPWMSINCADLI